MIIEISTKEDWMRKFDELCRSEQLEVLGGWQKRAIALRVKVPPISEPLVEYAWGVRALVMEHYGKVLSKESQTERRQLWDADLNGKQEPATDRVLFERDEVLDFMEQAFQDGLLAAGERPKEDGP
jgi:hypothetical protein